MSAQSVTFWRIVCDDCGIDSHPIEGPQAKQARAVLATVHRWQVVQVTWNKRLDLCPDCAARTPYDRTEGFTR